MKLYLAARYFPQDLVKTKTGLKIKGKFEDLPWMCKRQIFASTFVITIYNITYYSMSVWCLQFDALLSSGQKAIIVAKFYFYL